VQDPRCSVAAEPLIGPLLLCYHAVSRSWPAALAVTPGQLREHVAWLARRGYRGVTFHAAASAAPDSRMVAITFDDAFRSVIEEGLPVLEAAGFPATVFAPTDFIGTERPMRWRGVDRWLDGPHRHELVPMSWEELRTLAGLGWEIGSHTRSHPRLTEVDDATLERELRGSREQIESRLGSPCPSLAYPFGARDARVVEAASRAGYSFAAGTLRGRLRPPSRSLDWPRMVVNRVDGPHRFGLKISSAARWLRASRAWNGLVSIHRAAGRAPRWRS
jgi:peptidoglycan/xylan/chitin deacetylase (PgdA/CDA1 family)